MSKRIPIFLGLLLVLITCWLLLTPHPLARQLLDRLDNLGYDIQLRARLITNKAKPVNHIAIVDIDDKSLKAEGRWPWSRIKLADLVRFLQEQGAVVIAFDILFAEPEKNIVDEIVTELSQKKLLKGALENDLKKNAALFNADAIFSKSLMNHAVIFSMSFLPRQDMQNELPMPVLQLTSPEKNQIHLINAAGYISNISVLQRAVQDTGFINIFADNDGIIRRAPFLIQYKDKIYASLALQAVMAFFGEKINLVTEIYDKQMKLEGIQLGDTNIPTDEKGQVYIPFIGKSFTFQYYSATDVLHHRLPKDTLLGKIVFVGTSATGLGDLHPTAIENPFPGVEIQASIANGLLKNDFSYKPAWAFGANLFITLLLGCVAAILFPFFGPRGLTLTIVLLPLLLLFINHWIWVATKLILSFLIAILLILLIAILNMIYGYLFETRKREHLKEMFGQYVPAKHIEEMLKLSSNYGLYGEDREMSVLFADIRDFTSMSENMSASSLVEMLNTIFNPMTEIIFKYNGTIDKYVGDLIMAFWGAPLKDKHHAKHAIKSALDMRESIKLLSSNLAKRNWPNIKMGIGINSGIMSVGDMGSKYRRNYTVLGDEVNLASRIESLTKFYGVEIIVTDKTRQQTGEEFLFRKLDKVKVKGKKNGVEIYEVICYVKDCTPLLQTELRDYHQALDNYFQQQWQLAYQQMSHLLGLYPDKKIYQIYVTRLKELIEHDTVLHWDGIYTHLTK